MKGYVVRLADGAPLIYGERAEGTKVARLADDPANEFVPADDERAPQLEEAMRPKPRVPTYRDLRAIAYRDELGAEQGDFIKTLGDVLDVLIKEQRARGEAATAEAAALYAKVDEIKARHPRP